MYTASVLAPVNRPESYAACSCRWRAVCLPAAVVCYYSIIDCVCLPAAVVCWNWCALTASGSGRRTRPTNCMCVCGCMDVCYCLGESMEDYAPFFLFVTSCALSLVRWNYIRRTAGSRAVGQSGEIFRIYSHNECALCVCWFR